MAKLTKYRVMWDDDCDPWGDESQVVCYVLAENKKQIEDCFGEECNLSVMTEKEVVAQAKKQLAETVSSFKKTKADTLDDLGWDPIA